MATSSLALSVTKLDGPFSGGSFTIGTQVHCYISTQLASDQGQQLTICFAFHSFGKVYGHFLDYGRDSCLKKNKLSDHDQAYYLHIFFPLTPTV